MYVVLSVSGIGLFLIPYLLAVGTIWPNPIYACAFWPERAVERYMGPFNKTLANRVLVIGNTVSTTAGRFPKS